MAERAHIRDFILLALFLSIRLALDAGRVWIRSSSRSSNMHGDICYAKSHMGISAAGGSEHRILLRRVLPREHHLVL